MKKILCLILTLILVFTSLFAFSTTAYAADKTICNDSDSVNDNDYCYYEFTLDKPRYVTVSFSSSSELTFVIVDKESDYYPDCEELDYKDGQDYYSYVNKTTKSYSGKFYLYSGSYRVYLVGPKYDLYDDDYDDYDDYYDDYYDSFYDDENYYNDYYNNHYFDYNSFDEYIRATVPAPPAPVIPTINYSLKIVDSTAKPKKIVANPKTVKVSLGYYAGLYYDIKTKNALASKETWTSSNKKIATVDKNGNVKGKGMGKTTVKVKVNGGASTKFTVIVNNTYYQMFTGSSKKLPTVNGKKVKWKSGNSSVASVVGNKVKAKKTGKTTLTYKSGKTKYTVDVLAVSYDTLLKKTKSKIKDNLKDPDSMKIYHIWRGYDLYGSPTIILDYGAKNSYGAMVRSDKEVGYAYYDMDAKKVKYGLYTPEKLPELKSEKKVF